MSADEPTDLVAATNRLAKKVNDLAGQISVAEDQARRQRHTTRLVAVVVVVLIGALGYTYSLARDLKQNAVANCENANQGRLGAESLWLAIIDAPGPDGKPVKRPAAVQAQVDDLRAFVEGTYRQHDCSNLGKKYDLPEKPDSLKARK